MGIVPQNSPGFDRLAPIYDFLLALGPGKSILQSQRWCLERAHEIWTHRKPHTPPSILVLGGGTGLVLKPILQRFPNAYVVWVDSSAAMLRKAKGRFEALAPEFPRAQIAFGCHDILGLDERNATEQLGRRAFDLVLTPYVLDCFAKTTLTPLVLRLKVLLGAKGIWLHCDFQRPEGFWRRLWGGTMVAGLYLFFRLMAGIEAGHLPDWQGLFSGAGFSLAAKQSFFGGLLGAWIWEPLSFDALGSM